MTYGRLELDSALTVMKVWGLTSQHAGVEPKRAGTSDMAKYRTYRQYYSSRRRLGEFTTLSAAETAAAAIHTGRPSGWSRDHESPVICASWRPVTSIDGKHIYCDGDLPSGESCAISIEIVG